MAISYKFTNPVQAVNLPKRPAGGLPTNRSHPRPNSSTRISSRPTFKERLRVKKMMAIRDSAAYQSDQVTDFVKKRLDQQIATAASNSYDTDHQRLSTALERSRTSSSNHPSAANSFPAAAPDSNSSNTASSAELSSILADKVNNRS